MVYYQVEFSFEELKSALVICGSSKFLVWRFLLNKSCIFFSLVQCWENVFERSHEFRNGCRLSWNLDLATSHIEFLMEAPTEHGWIVAGISENGGVKGKTFTLTSVFKYITKLKKKIQKSALTSNFFRTFHEMVYALTDNFFIQMVTKDRWFLGVEVHLWIFFLFKKLLVFSPMISKETQWFGSEKCDWLKNLWIFDRLNSY